MLVSLFISFSLNIHPLPPKKNMYMHAKHTCGTSFFKVLIFFTMDFHVSCFFRDFLFKFQALLSAAGIGDVEVLQCLAAWPFHLKLLPKTKPPTVAMCAMIKSRYIGDGRPPTFNDGILIMGI